MKKIIILSLILLISYQNTALSKNILNKYLSKEQIDNIQDYKTTFLNIKSSKDLSNTYKMAEKLSEQLIENLNKSQEIESQYIKLSNFKELSNLILGLRLNNGAEGMGLNVLIDYKSFLEKAKKTPENDDNAFLNLMIEVFDDSGNMHPKWFIMTWDYGGYSLLGKGIHLKTLDKISNTLKISPNFNKELNDVKGRLINDILQTTNFASTKKDVINEINKIISTNNITKTDRIELHKKINDLETNPKKYQFNCEKDNCNYG